MPIEKKKKSCIWKSRLLADDVNKTVFPKICKTFTRVSKLLWSARSISFWARLDIHVVCSIVDWKQLMEKNGGCPVSDAIPSYVYSVVFRCSTRLDIDSVSRYWFTVVACGRMFWMRVQRMCFGQESCRGVHTTRLYGECNHSQNIQMRRSLGDPSGNLCGIVGDSCPPWNIVQLPILTSEGDWSF